MLPVGHMCSQALLSMHKPLISTHCHKVPGLSLSPLPPKHVCIQGHASVSCLSGVWQERVV